MSIEWRKKLTSRKFWAAVIAVITALLVLFGMDEMTGEKVIALISAEGSLIAYIFAEGAIDTARIESEDRRGR